MKRSPSADQSGLGRRRSTTALLKDRQADSHGARPQAWSRHVQQSRPASSIPSRPESRASRPSSRAASRLESRPSSRMESSRITGDTYEPRPKSGKVRPLSGRVFMRRTSEKGWVAKAYPDIRVSSQLDLDLHDDLSDVESLDSFFDDDFDTEQKDEKLQNLLSCNTLGVESKGRRKDWNAGEVAIPEFHCPRCRDHWYGLTQYPCDEELARLIREGLWYTGKEDKGKARDGKRHSARNRSINSAKREFGSLSSESLTGTSKRRGRKGEQDQSSRDPFSIGEDAIDEAQGKRKRRITFKLDDESIQGGGKGRGEEERVRLSSRDQTDGSLAEGTLLRDRGKHSNGSGTRGNEQSGDESGSLTDVGKSRRGRSRHSGGEGQDSSDGSSVWDTTASRQRTNRRRSRGKEEKGLSSAEDGSGGEGASGRGRNRLGKGQSLRDGGHQGEELGSESSRTGLGGGREDGHVGAGQSGLGAGLEQTNSQSGILAGHTGYVSSTGTGKGLGTSGTGIDSSNTAALSSHSRRGSLQSSSQVSKSGDRDDGGKRSQLGQADHGKKVRKAVGYMRAVSPSESEWGDPTHGRLYISSTATSSRAGSTSNLHRDQEDDNKPGLTLPPLIPPITNRKPLFAPMLDGFEFTRAWTFSYHNAGPLTAKLRSH